MICSECYRYLDDYLGFGRTIWDSTRSIWDSDLQYYGGTYMFVNMRRASYNWFILIALCFFVLSISGCKKARLRAQLKDLMESTIVLPDNITCVYNGEIMPMPDSLRDKPKLVVYIDSTECTTCRISRIGMYRQYFDLADQSGKLIVLVLLANTRFGEIPLVQYLADLEMHIPIYVDEENVFSISNPIIVGDSRLHAFLLNSENAPIVVGDPARSTHVQKLLLNKINQNML